MIITKKQAATKSGGMKASQIDACNAALSQRYAEASSLFLCCAPRYVTNDDIDPKNNKDAVRSFECTRVSRSIFFTAPKTIKASVSHQK